MEEGSKGKKKISTLQETLETESRRMEMKRKGDEQGKKPKRRKLDKLVGWGEASGLESIQQEGLERQSHHHHCKSGTRSC